MIATRSLSATGAGVLRVAGALGPAVRAGARWRVAAVLAWIVGALGAVAPTAFLGEPAAGLLAAPVLGVVAVAVVAPVLIAPLVASVVCDDDQFQVSAAWHSIGVTPTRRIVGRSLAAARASLRLLGVGGLAGALAGIGAAVAGPDPVHVDLRGGPGPPVVVVALGLLALAWLLGALVGAWAVSALRALVTLLVGMLITGAVASLLYFAPGLRVAFWCTPWAALWPFDPQAFDSAQFATSVPLGARVASGGAWLVLLAASTVRRRRRVPYPAAGESRRADR